jgi:hypothetical protein
MMQLKYYARSSRISARKQRTRCLRSLLFKLHKCTSSAGNQHVTRCMHHAVHNSTRWRHVPVPTVLAALREATA